MNTQPNRPTYAGQDAKGMMAVVGDDAAPHHLHLAGPLLISAGVIGLVIAFAGFTLTEHGVACVFIGGLLALLIPLGVSLTSASFMGEAMREQFGYIAPTVKEALHLDENGEAPKKSAAAQKNTK